MEQHSVEYSQSRATGYPKIDCYTSFSNANSSDLSVPSNIDVKEVVQYRIKYTGGDPQDIIRTRYTTSDMQGLFGASLS